MTTPLYTRELLPIFEAKVILRGDTGPSGELSEVRRFVAYNGSFYDLAWITSAPGMRREQLVIEPMEGWPDDASADDLVPPVRGADGVTLGEGGGEVQVGVRVLPTDAPGLG